jgi:hypothetical protein
MGRISSISERAEHNALVVVHCSGKPLVKSTNRKQNDIRYNLNIRYDIMCNIIYAPCRNPLICHMDISDLVQMMQKWFACNTWILSIVSALWGESGPTQTALEMQGDARRDKILKDFQFWPSHTCQNRATFYSPGLLRLNGLVTEDTQTSRLKHRARFFKKRR